MSSYAESPPVAAPALFTQAIRVRKGIPVLALVVVLLASFAVAGVQISLLTSALFLIAYREYSQPVNATLFLSPTAWQWREAQVLQSCRITNITQGPFWRSFVLQLGHHQQRRLTLFQCSMAPSQWRCLNILLQAKSCHQGACE